MHHLCRRFVCSAIFTGVVAGRPALAFSPPSFMVFFAFGESEITEQGERTINQFAAFFFNVGTGRVALTGHTDTAEASVPLSMSRAVAIKTRLLGMGLPVDRVSVVARGDKDLLVQTPPGTRDPQNRRVELVLHR